MEVRGNSRRFTKSKCISCSIDYGVFNHACDWSKLDVEEYGQNKYGGGHHGGISVDSDGYSLCPIGGAIDGLLKLGLRTKNLKQLFEKEFSN